MFVRRPLLLLVLVVLTTGALVVARPTRGAEPEVRYEVQPGDTLWEIALSRYDGDPRETVWRIRERNGLEGSLLQPGAMLVLPAAR